MQDFAVIFDRDETGVEADLGEKLGQGGLGRAGLGVAVDLEGDEIGHGEYLDRMIRAVETPIYRVSVGIASRQGHRFIASRRRVIGRAGFG